MVFPVDVLFLIIRNQTIRCQLTIIGETSLTTLLTFVNLPFQIIIYVKSKFVALQLVWLHDFPQNQD